MNAVVRPSPQSSPCQGEEDAKRQVRVLRARAQYSFAGGSFYWQLRFFPRFPTAWNIPKLIESFRLQNAGGDACAISASTVNGRRFGAIKFANPFAQLRKKNVACAGNSSFFPFTWRSH